MPKQESERVSCKLDPKNIFSHHNTRPKPKTSTTSKFARTTSGLSRFQDQVCAVPKSIQRPKTPHHLRDHLDPRDGLAARQRPRLRNGIEAAPHLQVPLPGVSPRRPNRPFLRPPLFPGSASSSTNAPRRTSSARTAPAPAERR